MLPFPIISPKTAQSDWSVGRVIDFMLSEDVSTLLIVNTDGKMVGIVSESALLAAAFDAPLRTDPISLHMQRKFVAVRQHDSIDQVVETFLLHRVRHLPVLDEDNRPVGIVSRRELLRQLFRHQLPV